MKDCLKNYLLDVFTLEFDLWFNDEEKTNNTGAYYLHFYNANMSERANVSFSINEVRWGYYTPSDENRNGNGNVPETSGWRHISISFNKRAFNLMGEINRIAKLMTDNPDLKFSVEGHTDSTGSETANQKLSDERSAAVVAKLVETGIGKDRLQSAGKGQTSPIADNSTDEGRAKNRRVEFVKI